MDVVIGTAGHIDHGKTALVKALTGVDADRLPEEKQRGITIDLGFAELDLGGGLHAAFVDVPGHERFVKNMLAGASGIDLVLLVIAADEGVMPQTREHFDICRLLDLHHGVVVITKSDLVDDEMLDLVKLEVADLTAGSFLENAPVMAVSSRTGDGIDELKETLSRVAGVLEETPDDSSAFLPIDRSFAVKGFGTVVTGTLASGEIKVGDELLILPSRKSVRVRGLQSHGRQTEGASSGRRVAVNLGGIGHDEVSRGEILAEPGLLLPTQIVNAEIDVLASAARPLRSRQRVRVHIGTAELLARVSILNESGEIEPAKKDFVQLRLESPAVARFGDRFIIRSYSPQSTIGGGRILDPLAARTRKSELTKLRTQLSKLAEPDTARSNILKTFVDAAGERGVPVANLNARTGWRRQIVVSDLNSSVQTGSITIADETVIAATALETVKNGLLAKIAAHHKREPLSKGISREALRSKILAPVFSAAIAKLTEEKKVEVNADLISLPSRTAELTPGESAVRDRIVSILERARLEVPKIEDLLASAIAGTNLDAVHARKLLKLLTDSGDLVKISDDFLFSRSTIDALIQKLREYADGAADRSIDVAKFKDLAGVSRKYAIPLLEYFDREKVTLRVGDKRVIR